MESDGRPGDGQTEVVHLSQRDSQDTEPLSTRVLLALDELPDYDALDADRVLSDEIDPDALDALFEPEGSTGSVTFTVDSYEVTVTAAGDVAVREF